MINKNKKDIFLYILYGVFTIIVILASYYIVLGDTKIISKIATILLFLTMELYFTVIMFYTSYYFTKNGLICRLGVLEINYPYDNIKEVKEVKSVSLFVNTNIKCIKIINNNLKSIRVSPLNKEDFLKELGKHGFLIVDKNQKKERNIK